MTKIENLTINNSIYNFAVRWLFSTNHKDIGTSNLYFLFDLNKLNQHFIYIKMMIKKKKLELISLLLIFLSIFNCMSILSISQLNILIFLSSIIIILYVYLEEVWKTNFFIGFFLLFLLIFLEMHLLFWYLLISSFFFLVLYVIKKDKDYLKIFTVSLLLFSISFLIFKQVFLTEYFTGVICAKNCNLPLYIGLEINYYDLHIPSFDKTKLLYLDNNLESTAGLIAINLKWYTPHLIGYYYWLTVFNDYFLSSNLNISLFILST